MKIALRALLVLLALGGVAAGVAWQGCQEQVTALGEPMPVTSPLEFQVRPGTGFGRVSRDMAERGWVAAPQFLAWYARYLDKARSVKAGTYRLEPGMSALDALELFVSGREVQYAFTIVEGWTFRQLRVALAAEPRLEQTLAAADDAAVMQTLGREGVHPEGQFLADTYHYPPGGSDRLVLERALAAQEALLAKEWQGRAPELPLDRPYQGLILASIIEKETGRPDERRRISGVFVERLRRGMLLQTDPTVIYGLGESFDGNLRRRDLRADTPYNTYTRKGLPPTPIALVGRASLAAALHPEVDGSLYFVSRGDGSHQFSRSYAEHQRAVRRYQLGGKSRRRTASGS